MTAFRLAHLSDLHLPPPDGAGEGGFKRLLSRHAWRRKGKRHSPEVLAAIVADVKAARSDHIAITGDLTNFSTAAEFAAAGAWLQGLGGAAGVTVSPGNHDALAGAKWADRFSVWSPWLGDETGPDFPKLRRRGPLAIVNLCSALPTAPGLAQGALGEAQLARLKALLPGLASEGLCRVILIHHPPVRGVVSRRKGLRDQDGLLAVLAETGAELLLHGHAHETALGTAKGPDGAIPSIGVPSASAVGEHYAAARWHEFGFMRDGERWRIEVQARGLGESGAVEALGGYFLGSPG